MQMTLQEKYTSRVIRDGSKGRPKLDPAGELTLRMDPRFHRMMVNHCVETGVTQRLFIEQAGAKLLEQPDATARFIRHRRHHPYYLEAMESRMHTIAMKAVLKTDLEDYCVQRDVSQKEFIEAAIELLVKDKELAARLKARRVDTDLSRAAYHASKALL